MEIHEYARRHAECLIALENEGFTFEMRGGTRVSGFQIEGDKLIAFFHTYGGSPVREEVWSFYHFGSWDSVRNSYGLIEMLKPRETIDWLRTVEPPLNETTEEDHGTS